MSRIYFLCPQTLQPVDTKLEIDPPGSFQGDVTVKCPHCGKNHKVEHTQMFCFRESNA